MVQEHRNEAIFCKEYKCSKTKYNEKEENEKHQFSIKIISNKKGDTGKGSVRTFKAA